MIALFFDTETTGIKTKENPDFDPGLVQLGAILQETQSRRVLAEVNLICGQYWHNEMQPGALKTHGISPEMTEKYGVEPALVDILFSQIISMADILVAHNLDYDLEIVNHNMPLSRQAIDKQQMFCTMDQNVMTIRKPKKDGHDYYGKPEQPYAYNSLLDTFRHYFGTEFEGAHDAMADVRACRDIFFKMHELKEEETK
jgi:DNA polymerase-3 subunit epsilon